MTSRAAKSSPHFAARLVADRWSPKPAAGVPGTPAAGLGSRATYPSFLSGPGWPVGQLGEGLAGQLASWAIDGWDSPASVGDGAVARWRPRPCVRRDLRDVVDWSMASAKANCRPSYCAVAGSGRIPDPPPPVSWLGLGENEVPDPAARGRCVVRLAPTALSKETVSRVVRCMFASRGVARRLAQ